MPVRVGIIGCGSIAQKRHIPECMANRHGRIVAVADINETRAVATAAKIARASKDPVAAYNDYRKLLADDTIEAVVVATPNAFHAPMSIDALKSGKHVMVEKPMAGTRADAKAMIAAAKKSGKFLMVGQNQRLMAPHAKAKEIMMSGKLGRPLVFRTSFQHPGPESWSIDGKKTWFFKPKEAVMGVCGDLGVHKADLMRFLLGEEITEVAGFLGTRDKTDEKGKLIGLDDNAFITMKTASGVLGTMTISWTNYGNIEDNITYIFCENGVLRLGMDKEFGVIVNHRSGRVEKIRTGAVATNTKQVKSGIMDMYLNSLVKNQQPPIDGNEGYKSLDVILTAIEAAQKGKTMRVKG